MKRHKKQTFKGGGRGVLYLKKEKKHTLSQEKEAHYTFNINNGTNTLLDLQNSSYPSQPHSIIANY